jgi:hypothetical protein
VPFAGRELEPKDFEALTGSAASRSPATVFATLGCPPGDRRHT